MANASNRGPKKTRRWVLFVDKAADRTITVGGILVIATVLGMMVFLVYEVLPLFQGGSVVSRANYPMGFDRESILGLSIDDYGTIGAAVARDGSVTAWHASTGAKLSVAPFDFHGKQATAFARSIDNENMVFGFSDGTVQFAKVGFKAEVLNQDKIPSGLTKLNERDSSDGSAVYSMIPGRQVRKIAVELALEEPVQVSESGSAITALGYRYTDFGERPKRTMVSVDSRGAVDFMVAESKLNLFTRKVKTDITKASLPAPPAETEVAYALVTEMGDEAYLAEKTGKVYRYNTKDLDHPVLAEAVRLMADGVELTALGFLAGDRSLVIGGSDGSVNISFVVPSQTKTSLDGFALTRTRTLVPQVAAVTGISSSMRGKTLASSDAAGNIWLRNGTSEKTLVQLEDEKDKIANEAFVLAPRLDGLLAVRQDGSASFWNLYIPHPETSWTTLFGKVWYEGYGEPSYTWQSTGATDAFEPKLSLIPLIFGTLKATFYSLLFAIPISLLAAVYTSEFLPYRVRAKIKPCMEVMASIPSVVLGFIAALVLAPIVENWIVSVLIVFVVAPLSFVIGGFLWQLVPPSLSIRFQGVGKLLAMFAVFCIAIFVSIRLSPFFESLFFGGNFTAWLNRDAGSAAPLMALLLLPGMAWAVGAISSRYFMPSFSVYIRRLSLPYSALVDMARWAGMASMVAIFSYVLAYFLELIGVDPRGSFVGTYVQRNTLIVGFAMGFAVIPLIYTLAEDALNSVPEHLRSASLGCGATPWQTAMWIILPTALSGVFSAIMIGMGRAVGETMIVVMSAGNTPLIDMNIFNGLRALSANIAVELPEAPKDATLYRVLFFTGLVLFAMTFVINTVAEIIRLRFRKRAMQL